MEKRRGHKRGRMRGKRGDPWSFFWFWFGCGFGGFVLRVRWEERREKESVVYLGHTTSSWTWA